MGRGGMIMTCRICGVEGHNKRGCQQRTHENAKASNQGRGSFEQGASNPTTGHATQEKENETPQTVTGLRSKGKEKIHETVKSKMEKSKEKVVECEERPIRNKGKEKIYETINSPQMENGKEKAQTISIVLSVMITVMSGQGKGIHISSSVEPKKRKASNDLVETQESIIKKKK
ncbi:hypothetical protein PTKIN_Ptkin03bG0191300 [Pterospermum kingtungense]